LMDTSKEYILMCEKAKKLQIMWKPVLTDIIFDKMTSHVEILGLLEDAHRRYYQFWEGINQNDISIFSNYIWLPRQGQLQDMIGSYKEAFNLFCHYGWRISEGYDTYCGKPDRDLQNTYIEQFTSMEQLWLAFVMKEKYNKQWNGKDWK